MEKIGYYSSQLLGKDLNQSDIKRLLLLFDSLMLPPRSLELIYQKEDNEDFIASFDYLINLKFLQPAEYNDDIYYSEEEQLLRRELSRVQEILNFSKVENLRLYSYCDDLHARLDALSLAKQSEKDIIPILRTRMGMENPINGHSVLNFALQKMPMPSINTPWEKIIDFKTDKDTRSKYLSLINWVNITARQKRNINEINDEFEYLYDQYLKSFKLHKITTNLTYWEVFVFAGIDVLSSFEAFKGISLMKKLFTIKKAQASLVTEEMKLPGKEIAYIYKANTVFGN